MKKTLLITFLFIAALAKGQEQDVKSYSFSLEQAIAHALANNYSAINAQRDIEAAEQKKWETTATGLPQISAGVDYQNNFELQKSLIPAEFFGGNPGEFAEVAFGTRHTMTARATLSQKIFDGSYIVALQASKTYLRYYQNYKKKNAAEIREMVTNSYGNVLLAEESIAILEKNKAALDKTLFDTNETFKNGLIEEENVEQLKITLLTVNNNLSYTKRLRDISHKMLKIDLGIDLQDELILTDDLDGLSLSNMDLSFTGTEFNVNNNIDYLIVENLVDQRTLEVKLQKSYALPSLSANLNAGYNGFGNEFNFFSSSQRWLDYSFLGVSLNIPIFSSFGRSAKTQQANIALEQANTQRTEVEQKLQLQYQNAKSDYEFSIENYISNKENLALAERIENKQQIKFTEGLSTSFDFTDAQRQLYTAQQNYLQSMVDVITKKAALEKIISNN